MSDYDDVNTVKRWMVIVASSEKEHVIIAKSELRHNYVKYLDCLHVVYDCQQKEVVGGDGWRDNWMSGKRDVVDGWANGRMRSWMGGERDGTMGIYKEDAHSLAHPAAPACGGFIGSIMYKYWPFYLHYAFKIEEKVVNYTAVNARSN